MAKDHLLYESYRLHCHACALLAQMARAIWLVMIGLEVQARYQAYVESSFDSFSDLVALLDSRCRGSDLSFAYHSLLDPTSSLIAVPERLQLQLFQNSGVILFLTEIRDLVF